MAVRALLRAWLYRPLFRERPLRRCAAAIRCSEPAALAACLCGLTLHTTGRSSTPERCFRAYQRCTARRFNSRLALPRARPRLGLDHRGADFRASREPIAGAACSSRVGGVASAARSTWGERAPTTPVLLEAFDGAEGYEPSPVALTTYFALDPYAMLLPMSIIWGPSPTGRRAPSTPNRRRVARGYGLGLALIKIKSLPLAGFPPSHFTRGTKSGT